MFHATSALEQLHHGIGGSMFVLRLTHLKEHPLDDEYATPVCFTVDPSAFAKSYLARALDEFDNVYYAYVIVFKNNHGCAVIHDPQLHRTCVQLIPSVMRLIDSELLAAKHPPLCQDCWKNETETGKLINFYRQHLQHVPKLAEKDSDVKLGELGDLFRKTEVREVLAGLVSNNSDPIDQLLRKNGGPN
jgi:hypothetical protein